MKQICLVVSVFAFLLSCEKERDELTADPDSGSEVVIILDSTVVIDIDSNVYKTVKIGNQIWMAENLKVTHYADGRELSYFNEVNGVKEPALFRFHFDGVSYDPDIQMDVDGELYNWHAARDTVSSGDALKVQGICPDGWHLPSMAEWRELEEFVCTQGYRGRESLALKSEQGWKNGMGGDDVYGFDAVPSGSTLQRHWTMYYGNGYFYVGKASLWWTSNSVDENNADFIGLYYSSSEIERGTVKKEAGMAVRCVKD